MASVYRRARRERGDRKVTIRSEGILTSGLSPARQEMGEKVLALAAEGRQRQNRLGAMLVLALCAESGRR